MVPVWAGSSSPESQADSPESQADSPESQPIEAKPRESQSPQSQAAPERQADSPKSQAAQRVSPGIPSPRSPNPRESGRGEKKELVWVTHNYRIMVASWLTMSFPLRIKYAF